MKIFIASLPFSISETDVLKAFSNYGIVSSVKIINDKVSGKSRGFGFIEMPDEIRAAKAIEDLNGADVNGRLIVVRRANERNNNQETTSVLTSQCKNDQPVTFIKKPRNQPE